MLGPPLIVSPTLPIPGHVRAHPRWRHFGPLSAGTGDDDPAGQVELVVTCSSAPFARQVRPDPSRARGRHHRRCGTV